MFGGFWLGDSVGRTRGGGLGSGTAPQLRGVDYGEAVNTLVIVLRRGCRPCVESVPMLQRIRERRDVGDSTVAIVFASRDHESDFRAFLGEHGLLPAATVRLGPHQWPEVGTTPSFLQVDSLGMVRRAWIGVDESMEGDILEQFGLTDEAIGRKRAEANVAKDDLPVIAPK